MRVTRKVRLSALATHVCLFVWCIGLEDLAAVQPGRIARHARLPFSLARLHRKMSTPLDQALSALQPHLRVLSAVAPAPGALRAAHDCCAAFLDHPLALPCAEALLTATGPGCDSHMRMYALQIIDRAVAQRGGRGAPELHALLLRLIVPGGALAAASPGFVVTKLAAAIAGLLEREFPQRWPDGLHALASLAGESKARLTMPLAGRARRFHPFSIAVTHGGPTAEAAALAMQVKSSKPVVSHAAP